MSRCVSFQRTAVICSNFDTSSRRTSVMARTEVVFLCTK
jgi:hypothetical protein